LGSLVAGLLLSCAAPETNYEQATLVIEKATIVDGRSGSRQEGVTIVVEGDRIAFVGDSTPGGIPPDVTRVDGSGKWIVAGLIDVHVHDVTDDYLRGMLAWGVTSVHLMPADPPQRPANRQQESEQAATATPRLQMTEMFASVFPDNVVPGVYRLRKPQTEAEARSAVREMHANGYRQIKIIQDDSSLWTGPENPVPPLAPLLFGALVSEAQVQGMRVYVHATQRSQTQMALEAGIDGFMHGTMDAELTTDDWQSMKASSTVWTPAVHALRWYGDRKSYAARITDDPRLTAWMTEEERTEFETLAAAESPLFLPALSTLVESTDSYIRVLAANTRAAQAVGVVVAVGSDGGPAGVCTHLELEFLQEIGLTATDALAAATYGGAVALGREEELGSVEVGKLADLVILNSDPTVDIRNSRDIASVVKGGRVYRPHELMADQAVQ
jgi:imidazolonepropionase-like amidohydrolase